MTELYSCDRCGYETDTKNTLIRHLQRKILCPPTFENKDPHIIIQELTKRSLNDITYPCRYCDKPFNSPQGRCRHHNTCKKRPEGSITNSHNISNTNSETNSDSHNSTNNLVNNNNHSHNNTNVQNNNVVVKLELREFGQENMAALPNSAIRDNIIFLRFIDLLEMLHFDDEFPENRNFRLVSLKQELMEFYKNKKWHCVSLPTGIDDIIRHSCRIFMNFYNDNKEDVHEDMGEDEADAMFEKLEEIYACTKRHVKDLRKDLKALLYNNKGTA